MSTDHLLRITEVVRQVSLNNHVLLVGRYTDPEGQAVEAYYVQDTYQRRDALNHHVETGYGRKWHISIHATESEIVYTCLKAMITNAEHEVREGFEYRGARIFQPHTSVEALFGACLVSDAREVPYKADEYMRGEILG